MNSVTRFLVLAGLLTASAMEGNDCSYFIKTTTDDNFCITLPTSQYRQGLVVILGQCDPMNAQQKFRFDPFNYHISPADSAEWCLDFDFDDKKYRPLTLFKCGQTFSDFTDDNHQRWLWPNYVKGEAGPLKNRGTGMCVGVGKDLYAGKYVQQYDCEGVSTFSFAEADKLIKIGNK